MSGVLNDTDSGLLLVDLLLFSSAVWFSAQFGQEMAVFCPNGTVLRFSDEIFGTVPTRKAGFLPERCCLPVLSSGEVYSSLQI